MEPQRFEAPVPATDSPSLKRAILHGYQAMDRLLGRMACDYPDTLLVLCTALSQQPWPETTKCTFRPTRFETLLQFARVAPARARVKPVMAEEFHLECPTAEEAELVQVRFEELTVADQPLMKVERSGKSLFAGCLITDALVADRSVVRRSDGARVPFGDLFHMVHTMRSGRHHPDGVLWVRNGRHRIVSGRVPLTAIAPSVLRYFGLRPPDSMTQKPLPF
jgi:hypothetical protein